MKKQNKKIGFSLLELSLAILITSFLLVGVFAGKELVFKARLRGAQELTKSSPVSSIPDLELWLETTFDKSFTDTNATVGNLSNGNNISSWNDMSKNAINVTQSTSANQPTYIKNGIGGLPTVRFDGNDVMYSTSTPIDEGNKKYTMIAVWKIRSFSDCILAEQKQALTSIHRQGSIWLNNASLRMSGFSNDTNSMATLSANNPYIFTMVINDLDSNNVNGYLNSNSVIAATTSSPGNLNISKNVFSIGGRVSTVSYTASLMCSVDVSELIIFNRNLNPSEIQLINNYLSQKYNITLS